MLRLGVAMLAIVLLAAAPMPAAEHSLPDPLKLKNGSRVDTTDKWWQLRRQEVADDLEAEIYGHASDNAPVLVWTVAGSTREMLGHVPAVTRRLLGHAAGLHGLVLDVRLTLTLPAKTKGPVPVILELDLPGQAGGAPSPWKTQVLAKGWGAAVLDVSSVQPDSAEGLAGGVIGLAAAGKPRGPYDWGVLRAWAWGASRAMDYFESDNLVASDRIGIAGHARFGKAALVAMAYDPRFVVAFISSSGAGGAALLRHGRVDTLVAKGQSQLFADEFRSYAGPKTAADLPVDAHELLALCAPRPVFVSDGANDDASGEFQAEVAAGPVYRLLGAKDLGTAKLPQVGMALTGGALAFRQHAGADTADSNWPVFIAFAQRILNAPRKH